MTTTTYRVDGMTCGHCVSAVTQELSKLPTVTSVDVQLETGEVTVASDTPLELDDVRAAVDEAGYELAS
jgi:copper chaperone CopZ